MQHEKLGFAPKIHLEILQLSILGLVKLQYFHSLLQCQCTGKMDFQGAWLPWDINCTDNGALPLWGNFCEGAQEHAGDCIANRQQSKGKLQLKTVLTLLNR